MSVFWTSDHHFGHANIIDYLQMSRPYDNVDSMNKDYVEKWNSQVGPDDTVYHIGDLCWGGYHESIEHVGKLNGRIFVVPGNHDRWYRNNLHRLPLSASGYAVEILSPIHVMRYEDKTLVLCHYPMRSWPHSFHGSWHLYGHVHKTLSPWGFSMNVGVDCHEGRLCDWDTISGYLNSLSKPRETVVN